MSFVSNLNGDMISQLGSFTKQCWTLSYDLTDNDRKKPTLIKYVADYSFFFLDDYLQDSGNIESLRMQYRGLISKQKWY